MAKREKLMIEHEQADRDYWNELATVLGWTLYGWTDRTEAQFLIGSGLKQALVWVPYEMRDDILKALGTVRVTPEVTREFSTMYESCGKPVFL